MGDTLAEIRQAVIERQRDRIEGLVREVLDEGMEPYVVINDGLIPAMDEIGKMFTEHKIFVPEMLVSAMTMKMGLDVVKPLLKGAQSEPKGTVFLGTVKGDLHDIGKNIVGMMLEGAGFRVVDLGVDLTVEKLMEQVETQSPDIIGLSALLTTTMPEMERVVQELEARGLRDRIKVMVGGAPVSAAFAEKIGADGYGGDAAQAVELARRLSGADR